MSSQQTISTHLEHRAIWDSKPVLREVYEHLYERMLAACVAGTIVEIGGGSGNLKKNSPDVLSFDIVSAPWLDFVADAQFLPFASASIQNLVMLDVLHHIEVPLCFLREAARALKPGGRLVMMEPAISALSWPFYRFVHQEPVLFDVDPLVSREPDPGKDPYMGNQAIPSLLVTREQARLASLVPELQLLRVEWLSLWAYPLSGGFKRWSLLNARIARTLLRWEDRAAPIVGRLAGFRLLIVLEKRK